MIGKIPEVNQLNQLYGSKRSDRIAAPSYTPDTISVSDEAKAMAEMVRMNQIASETPDVREDFVEQLKAKIQDPNYLNEATLAATADRILSAYGF